MATFENFVEGLSLLAAPDSADEIAIRDDSAAETKRITWSDLLTATAADAQTLTNKTITDSSNTVYAKELVLDVRNESGGTLTKGTPVYVSGYNVGQALVEVSAADATLASTMPAVGLVAADIANAATGQVVAAGVLESFDTSAFSVGDRLYVSETAGTLTATRPTGTAQVQSVGSVVRSNVSTGAVDVDLSSTFKTGFAAELLEDGTAADARSHLGLGTMAVETAADYATLASPTFTGNVIVPDATADGEALAYDQASWQLGAGRFTGDIELDNSTPEILLRDSNQVDPNTLSIYNNGGNGALRVLNDDGSYVGQLASFNLSANAVTFAPASSVTVPDATADGEAIAYDQANWQLAGGTFTDDVSIESGTSADLTLRDTAGTANSKTYRVRADGSSFRLYGLDDANSISTTFLTANTSTGALDMSGATSVAVPAATAATHAAQVSDYDATLGQLQIGGIEMGDTGWRDVSSLLTTGWSVGAGGHLRLRRVGNAVTWHARNLSYAGGGSTSLTSALSAGFEVDQTVQFLYTTTALAGATPTIEQGYTGTTPTPTLILASTDSGVTFHFTYYTSGAWPASLPGTAA